MIPQSQPNLQGTWPKQRQLGHMSAGRELKLRGVILNQFDGHSWSNNREKTPLKRGPDGSFDLRGVGSEERTPSAGYPVHYQVTLEPFVNNVFFLMSNPQSLHGNYRQLTADSFADVYDYDPDRPVTRYEADSILRLGRTRVGDHVSGYPFQVLLDFMMAVRLTGRRSVVVARSVHPEYREVLSTYAFHQGMPLATVPFKDNGRVDFKELEAILTPDTACVLVQSPNFFGTIEDVEAIGALAHSKGALLVVAIAEAVSLGIVAPPRSADIIGMEAQSFGVPLGFGGPYCGVIATRETYVRQMPGRLVGQTTDRNGKRGFVLTLATREQHIRREKATSNICTNQALIALMANIFMTVYGKVGLRELAKQNLAKAAYAAQQFGKHGRPPARELPRPTYAQ